MFTDYKNRAYKKKIPPMLRWRPLALVIGLIALYSLISLFRTPELRLDLEGRTAESIPIPHATETVVATDVVDPELLTTSDRYTAHLISIEDGDTLAGIFKKLSLGPKTVHYASHAGSEAKHLQRLQPGKTMNISLTGAGEFHSLEYNLSHKEVLKVWQDDEGQWLSLIDTPEIETRVAFGGAYIDDSLFLAGKRAGLDDRLIMTLADLYAWDIDFLQDIRPNDEFKVLYEEHYVDGQKVANGPILAASFTNQGKTTRLIRFEDARGQTNYYTPDGRNARKAFLRTPVNFTHVSSKFDLHRKHPILHKIRAHRGVDYAAPQGTDVKSTGDGKVIFSGVQNGFGNVVKIQHGRKYTTVYAHLSKFAKGIRAGTIVKQGQVIGHVGMTGLATAPHLHYEFHVDGTHQDPLTVALPKADPLPKSALPHFQAHAYDLIALMETHQKIMLASNEITNAP